MDESRKVIRIFLGSPNDLKEERIAAKQAVDELNQSWVARYGFHVELVGWELTVAAVGRPQALINQDLDACEYFIGMVWKRWGTPPAKDGVYHSGFEEEFEASLKRHRETGKPEISLYFKALEPAERLDPGPQLQRVLDFKKKVMDAQELMFEEFSSPGDFEAKVRRAIYAYVVKLKAEETSVSEAATQATAKAGTSPVPVGQGRQSPWSSEGANFLQALISKAHGAEDGDGLTPVEIARFRLLGTVLSVDSEDPPLAVHDANRIFAVRRELDLGLAEKWALLDAGLAEYGQDNVPVWSWLVSIDDAEAASKLSIAGRTEAIKIGALLAMRDLGQPLQADSVFPRSLFLENWFGTDVGAGRREAALRYLAEQGLPSDISAIEVELERKDYQTSTAAIDALLRISRRESRARAFSKLLELQPETVDVRLVADLLSNPAGIALTDIQKGTRHRSTNVRLACLKTLSKRDALPVELAEQCLDDSSLEVRLEAMKCLSGKGRIFSDSQADQLLVVRERGLGLLAFGRSKINDDRLVEFRGWRLDGASDADLAVSGSIYDRDGEFVLDERHYARRAKALKVAIADEYAAKFEEALKEMGVLVGGNEAVIADTRKLERFVRQGHTRKGLDVVCRRGDAQDLTLVRRMMDGGFVSYSKDEMAFLRRFGEWEDIPRIVRALDREPTARSGGSTILGSLMIGRSDGSNDVAAQTIIALGRGRTAELLAIEMPDPLRREILLELTDVAIVGLPDASLMESFRSKDAEVRKVVALRAVKAMSKARLKALMEAYFLESYRFYNVIVWLDLGVSLPRAVSKPAAQRLLERIQG